MSLNVSRSTSLSASTCASSGAHLFVCGRRKPLSVSTPLSTNQVQSYPYRPCEIDQSLSELSTWLPSFGLSRPFRQRPGISSATLFPGPERMQRLGTPLSPGETLLQAELQEFFSNSLPSFIILAARRLLQTSRFARLQYWHQCRVPRKIKVVQRSSKERRNIFKQSPDLPLPVHVISNQSSTAQLLVISKVSLQLNLPRQLGEQIAKFLEMEGRIAIKPATCHASNRYFNFFAIAPSNHLTVFSNIQQTLISQRCKTNRTQKNFEVIFKVASRRPQDPRAKAPRAPFPLTSSSNN